MSERRGALLGAAAVLLLIAIELPTHVRWYRADLLPPDDFAGYAAAIAHVRADLALYGEVPRWCPRLSGGAVHYMSTMKERLAAPLVSFVGPTRAAKLFAIALRTLAAVGFFVAFVRLTRSRSAALPAAYVYGYGPQTAHFMAYGHLDILLVLALLPGVVVAAAGTVLRPERLPRLLLGVLLALVARANLIALHGALLLVVAVAVFRPAMDGEPRPPLSRALWRTGEALLVFAMLAIAPLLWLVMAAPHQFDPTPLADWKIRLFSFPSPLILVNRADWLTYWLPYLYAGVFTGLGDTTPRHACYVGVTVLATMTAALVVARRSPPFLRWMAVAAVVGLIQLSLAHGPTPLAAALAVRNSPVGQTGSDVWLARIAGVALVVGTVRAEGRRRRLLLVLGTVVLATTIPWFLVLRSVVPMWESLRSPAHFADTLVLATAWAFGMSLVALERVLIRSWWRRIAVSMLVLAVAALDLWPSHREFGVGTRLAPLEQSVEALATAARWEPSRRVLPADAVLRPANLALESVPASSARSWVRWESTLFWQKLLTMIERGPAPQATPLMRAARIDRSLSFRDRADPPFATSTPMTVYPEAWWFTPWAPQGAPPIAITPRRPAPGHLRLRVQPEDQPGRVVVSEAYHPWWRATVDGRSEPVGVEHVALMAVAVPAGARDVRLDFEIPAALWAADLVDCAAWIAVALAAGILLWPGARRVLRRIVPEGAPFRAGCVLGLLLFLLYNANGREIGYGDTIPAMLLPASLLREGNFDLNEFDGLLRSNPNPVFWMLAVQLRGDRLVSSYPVGASILSVPIYAPFVATGGVRTWTEFRLMSKLSASLFVALSAVFLFAVMRRFVSSEAAALLTIAYGLGTSAWPLASQALWQHGPGMFCLAVAVWLTSRLEDPKARRYGLVPLGIALGFAVASRSLNVVPALLLGVHALRMERRHGLGLPVVLAAFAASIALYNYTIFGDVRGGYDAIFHSIALRPLHIAPGTEFDHPLLPGLLGLLVSPSRGLLWFSPFVVFATAGAVRACRPGGWPLGRVLVVWVVAMLAVYSKYVMWWGGGSYGPRLLIEVQIPLVLLVAYGWPSWRPSALLTAVFAVCLAVAIAIQGIGAFYAPCDWYGRPVPLDLHPERVWDWRDPEPLRCWLAGPRPFDLPPLNPSPVAQYR